MYPWIKLLPARLTPGADFEEGYDEGDLDGGLQVTNSYRGSDIHGIYL